MNATRGPGVDVHADEHGPVYVISIVRSADDTMSMSYTGAHGENGNCNVR
jgi:hypothetical protein